MALSKRQVAGLSRESSEEAPGKLREVDSPKSREKTTDVKSYSIQLALLDRLEAFRKDRGLRSTSKIVNDAIKLYLDTNE